MNQSSHIRMGVVMSVLVVLGCSVSRAQQKAQLRYIKSADKAVPLSQYALPYQGLGAVVIVDDGTLLIEVGGQLDEDVEASLVSDEAIAYQLDTSGLRVIERGGEVFLDQNGKQLSEQGLRERQVTVIPFVNTANPNPTALFEFTGQLDLNFDAATGLLSVTITDTESSGQAFHLSAPIQIAKPAATQGKVLLVDSNAIAASDNPNDPIVLFSMGEMKSKCSIACNNGNGSIECTRRGCICICKTNGEPKCECVGKVSAIDP